ncbi:hypothetical protein GGR54DRAFT_411507 [Hypoxylon sp. NC1633]|nr:hypothetical protein GGR54DRAFT_411507 [Hypoxylon sp. NC1633]
MSNFIQCNQGHTHFGRYGAAGVLLYRFRESGEVEMLLAKRAQGTDEEGTWSTIGGAMDQGETPQAAAIREVKEELGINLDDFQTTETIVYDHGNWSYTTSLSTPKDRNMKIQFKLLTSEISEVRWVSRPELERIGTLHKGFQESLPELLTLLPLWGGCLDSHIKALEGGRKLRR